MKNFDHIPLTVEHYPESWYNWTQSFSVPKGWKYMRDSDRDYQYAYCDMEIDLYCSGDWLEIVNEEQNVRILYVID